MIVEEENESDLEVPVNVTHVILSTKPKTPKMKKKLTNGNEKEEENELWRVTYTIYLANCQGNNQIKLNSDKHTTWKSDNPENFMM